MKTDSIFIIHLNRNRAIKAFAKALKIKPECAKGENLLPDFTESMKRGRQDYKNRKGTRMTPD